MESLFARLFTGDVLTAPVRVRGSQVIFSFSISASAIGTPIEHTSLRIEIFDVVSAPRVVYTEKLSVDIETPTIPFIGVLDNIPLRYQLTVTCIVGAALVILDDVIVPSPVTGDNEVPSGAIDGINATFTLASTPILNSEHVYLRGIRRRPGAGNDYTISGDTITFLAGSIPQAGDNLLVDYLT